ncbi:MAG: sigma factor-like helix-turn-helix DNA-binding protein [Streptosporangiaceae bacterium]
MRKTVTSVQDKDRASLPGGDAARACAGGFALPHGIPEQPGEQEGHGAGESPGHVLTTVVSDLSRQLTYHVGGNCWLGRALVFRAWPLRSLHVVGGTPMAEALRELIATGTAPGWALHRVSGGRTALDVLAAPLYRLSGQQRFYNLLDRAGFAWAEEVAATPEVCLLELRNTGPKFIAAVRRALSELGIDGASASPEGAGERRDPGQASSPPAVPAELAGRLLQKVADDRRRLILTSRTFAPERRTYDSLAAGFGGSRGRVRQLETSALQQLAHAAVEDLYAPLRWRAASAGRPGAALAAEVPGAPPWMRRLLSWLAEKTA